jgi:hypothetical protein
MIKIYRRFILTAIIGSAFIASSVDAKLLAEDRINQQLVMMESPVEDMLEGMENGNTDKLKLQFKDISKAMNELNKINTKRDSADVLSREISLQNSWFNLISLEIAEMDDLPALAFVTNQFSGQLVMATRFDHEYEKDIAWMDYLGRELLILNKYPSAAVNSEVLIKIRKAELNATWNNIRTIVSARNDGASLIRRVDTVMQQIMNETEAVKLVNLSNQALELVDKIESYFHID